MTTRYSTSRRIVFLLCLCCSVACAPSAVGQLREKATLDSSQTRTKAKEPARAKGGAASACIAGGTVDEPFYEGSGSTRESSVRKSVAVATFLIDTAEVTVGDYLACVESGKCRALPDLKEIPGFDYCAVNLDLTTADSRAAPMNCVTWEEAAEYCRASSKRLPLNSEWELAFRGITHRKFPWGAADPDEAHACLCFKQNHAECKDQIASRERAYPAGKSAEGVFDLVGNVAEWVDGRTHPRDAGNRLIRGLSCDSRPDPDGFWLDAAPASFRSASVGFRCASSVSSGSPGCATP